MTDIGTLREGPLHAALKVWLAEPGDLLEVAVGGWVVDLVRGDQLVEVQTGGLAPLKAKLDALLDHHPIRVVVPLPYRSLITKVDGDGQVIDERWSPKRATRLSVFARLVSFPSLVDHPHLTVQVLGITQREIRHHRQGMARRRGGWTITERHLIDVVDDVTVASPDDLTDLLPALPTPFTTADLCSEAGVNPRLAQQIAYCLRATGSFREVGRSGRSRSYALAEGSA